MAKVKAIATGYYGHRTVAIGEVFTMKGVDEKGFYVDAKGKRKLFAKVNRDGVKIGEEERKCRWVDHVSTEADKPLDPKEVAAVISGRNPGNAEVEDEELEEAPAKETPVKGK